MEEAKARYRWVIETLVYSGSIVMAMVWLSVAPMMIELTEDLKISFTEAGFLIGVIGLVVGMIAFVSGAVAGKIGLRLTTCLGLTIMAIGGIITGILPNYNVVLIGRILFAVGAGLFFPMIGAIIMQWFVNKELLIVNSVNFSGMTVGMFIAFLITPPLMDAFGWQMTLIMYSSLCAIIAILSWLYLKERTYMRSLEDMAQQPVKKGKDFFHMLRMKETWLLAFCFFAPMTSGLAIATFLPAHWVKETGMTMAVASRWVSIMYLAGIPAAIVGGIWSAQAGLRKPFLVYDGILLGIGCLGAVLFSGSISILCLILAGMGMSFYTGTFFTIPMEIEGMTPQAVGLLLGIITFIGNMGGFITPLIVGTIEQMTGSLKGGLLLFGVIGFLMAILPLFIQETGPKAKRTIAHSRRLMNEVSINSDNT